MGKGESSAGSCIWRYRESEFVLCRSPSALHLDVPKTEPKQSVTAFVHDWKESKNRMFLVGHISTKLLIPLTDWKELLPI